MANSLREKEEAAGAFTECNGAFVGHHLSAFQRSTAPPIHFPSSDSISSKEQSQFYKWSSEWPQYFEEALLPWRTRNAQLINYISRKHRHTHACTHVCTHTHASFHLRKRNH